MQKQEVIIRNPMALNEDALGEDVVGMGGEDEFTLHTFLIHKENAAKVIKTAKEVLDTGEPLTLFWYTRK